MARVDIFLEKYYTDWHDADEDQVTLLYQGGNWSAVDNVGDGFGMFRRDLHTMDVSWFLGIVASYVDISKLIKYYTDTHDVDEDLGAISSQSGGWSEGSDAGLARRTMNATPSVSLNVVASSIIRNTRYYTDYHDVDEDKVTGVIYGERWWHGSETGIAHREMYLDQTSLVEYVASLKKINRTYSPFGDACSFAEDR